MAAAMVTLILFSILMQYDTGYLAIEKGVIMPTSDSVSKGLTITSIALAAGIGVCIASLTYVKPDTHDQSHGHTMSQRVSGGFSKYHIAIGLGVVFLLASIVMGYITEHIDPEEGDLKYGVGAGSKWCMACAIAMSLLVVGFLAKRGYDGSPKYRATAANAYRASRIARPAYHS